MEPGYNFFFGDAFYTGDVTVKRLKHQNFNIQYGRPEFRCT